MNYYYICDQSLPCHDSMNCVENGGDCHCTSHIEHAAHKDREMKFIKIGLDLAVEVEEEDLNDSDDLV